MLLAASFQGHSLLSSVDASQLADSFIILLYGLLDGWQVELWATIFELDGVEHSGVGLNIKLAFAVFDGLLDFLALVALTVATPAFVDALSLALELDADDGALDQEVQVDHNVTEKGHEEQDV